MKNSSKILGTVALVAATLIFIAVAIKVQQDWQLFLVYEFYYTKYVYAALIPVSLIWYASQREGWFPAWFPYEKGFIRMCLINATLSIPICLLVEVESTRVYFITASAVYVVTYILMSLIEFFSFFQAYYQYADE
jgi:hypothetical protein